MSMTKRWLLLLVLLIAAGWSIAAYASEKPADIKKLESSLLTAADKIKGVEIQKTDAGVVLTVRNLFTTGKLTFTPDGLKVIEKIARLIEDHPVPAIEIGGHTDSMGSAAFNKRIGQKRAEAIKSFVLEKTKIKAERIKTIGYGETRPIASNRTEEGRLKNRRIEIFFKFK
jgi:outer membrane protein OmpA-like peptidoglycan-associated protein